MTAEYDFTLVLSGVPELTAAVEDALFEAGCDDATLSLQGGEVSLDFTRAAPSLHEAVAGAVGDVRRAGIGADVLRVELPDGSPADELVAGADSSIESAAPLPLAPPA